MKFEVLFPPARGSFRGGCDAALGSLEAGAEVFLRKMAGYSNDQLAVFKKNLGTDDDGLVDGTLRPLRDALRPYVARQTPLTLEQLTLASVSRTDETELLRSMKDRDADAAFHVLKQIRQVAQSWMRREDSSLGLAQYRKADTKHPGTWIRTPSVVKSAAGGMTGGHNLSAKVTVLRPMTLCS